MERCTSTLPPASRSTLWPKELPAPVLPMLARSNRLPPALMLRSPEADNSPALMVTEPDPTPPVVLMDFCTLVAPASFTVPVPAFRDTDLPMMKPALMLPPLLALNLTLPPEALRLPPTRLIAPVSVVTLRLPLVVLMVL